MKNVWGCEKKTQLPIPTFEYINNDVQYRFWNCPRTFIPDSILKFLKIYKYHKDFPGAKMPDVENVSGRFFCAYQFYDSQVNESTKEVDENNAK